MKKLGDTERHREGQRTTEKGNQTGEAADFRTSTSAKEASGDARYKFSYEKCCQKANPNRECGEHPISGDDSHYCVTHGEMLEEDIEIGGDGPVHEVNGEGRIGQPSRPRL